MLHFFVKIKKKLFSVNKTPKRMLMRDRGMTESEY